MLSDLSQRELAIRILERDPWCSMARAELGWSEDERALFLSRKKAEMERVSNLLTAEDRGRRLGRTEVALNMKTSGMSVEIIAQLTKLPVREIEKL